MNLNLIVTIFYLPSVFKYTSFHILDSGGGVREKLAIVHSLLLLLLLLLRHFSRVRLCATPETRSPVPGILQARTLGWVAISFSNA